MSNSPILSNEGRYLRTNFNKERKRSGKGGRYASIELDATARPSDKLAQSACNRHYLK